MQEEQQPAKDNSVAEIRLISEQVQHAARLVELRIAEQDRRNDTLLRTITEARDTTEERAHLFGVRLASGVVIGLVILFVVLLTTMQPIVETVTQRIVEGAAERIDWDVEVNKVVEGELRKRVTAETLSKAVNNDAISVAASEVVESLEFQTIIRAQAEDAARAAVTSTVDKIVADTNGFRAAIDQQLRAEKDRLQAATSTFFPVTAANREELAEQLLPIVEASGKLGATWTNVDIYPFERDVLHIRSRILWQAENPADERVKIYYLTIEKLGATDPARRKTVEAYLDQATVPGSVGVKRSDAGGKKFAAGDFHQLAESKHSNFADASKIAIENSIELVDDCFSIEYPVTWRVQAGK